MNGATKTYSLRRLWFYYQYLKHEGMIDQNQNPAREINQLMNLIESCGVEVGSNRFGHPRSEEILSSMDLAFERNIIQEDKFIWLKNDELACYWLYAHLCIKNDAEIKKWVESTHWTQRGQVFPQNNFNGRANKFSGLGFKMPLPSAKQCFENIMIYFYDLDAYDYAQKPSFWNTLFLGDRAPRSGKEILLECLKEKYEQEINKGPIFKWLKKENKEQCDWVWCYIQSQATSDMVSSPRTLLNQFGVVFDSYQKYLFLNVIFALWEPNKDTKKIFIDTLRKAWSQRKFRAKQEKQNRVPLNTHLKKTTKDRLEQLAHRKNINMRDVLEHLINKAFAEEKNYKEGWE